MPEHPDHDAVRSVVWRGLALLAAFAVVVALGTYVVVHALGLSDSGSDTTTVGQPAPPTPLPTTALPEPSASNTPGGDGDAQNLLPSGQPSPGSSRPGDRGLHLAIAPLVASPMERLNLTGSYRGHDNLSLQVQRWENGTWADFPTTANVSMGTFETYVMTSHPGPNRFRVHDPATGRSSNVITISIQ